MANSRITKSVQKLLYSKKYSDVIFCVEESIIYAHKCIIATQSDVFERHFQGEWNDKSFIIINDIPSHIFKMFLEFIYTENIDKLKTLTLDDNMYLFYCSQKYMIDELKLYLRSTIIYQLTTNTALYIYDLYSNLIANTYIERYCIKIIQDFTKQTLQSKMFDNISRECLIRLHKLETISCTTICLLEYSDKWSVINDYDLRTDKEFMHVINCSKMIESAFNWCRSNNYIPQDIVYNYRFNKINKFQPFIFKVSIPTDTLYIESSDEIFRQLISTQIVSSLDICVIGIQLNVLAAMITEGEVSMYNNRSQLLATINITKSSNQCYKNIYFDNIVNINANQVYFMRTEYIDRKGTPKIPFTCDSIKYDCKRTPYEFVQPVNHLKITSSYTNKCLVSQIILKNID